MNTMDLDLLGLAKSTYEKGKYKETIEIINNANEGSISEKLMVYLLKAYFALGEYDTVHELISKIDDYKNIDSELFETILKVYEMLSYTTDKSYRSVAYEKIKVFSSKKDLSFDDKLSLIKVYRHFDDYVQYTVLSLSLVDETDDLNKLNELADSLMKITLTENALYCLKKIERLTNSELAVLSRKATCISRLDQSKERVVSEAYLLMTLAYLEKIEFTNEVKASLVAVRKLLSEIHYSCSRYVECYEECLKVLDIDEEEKNTYALIGEVLNALGRYGEVIENYERYFKHFEIDFINARELGYCYKMLGDYEQALKYYSVAQEFNTNDKRTQSELQEVLKLSNKL